MEPITLPIPPIQSRHRKNMDKLLFSYEVDPGEVFQKNILFPHPLKSGPLSSAPHSDPHLPRAVQVTAFLFLLIFAHLRSLP